MTATEAIALLRKLAEKHAHKSNRDARVVTAGLELLPQVLVAERERVAIFIRAFL